MTEFKHQDGLTLIEVLVAMIVSLFLLGGIVQVYIGNKSTYQFADASSRLQETGRFALDTITTDLRRAGTWGCIGIQSDRDNDGDLTDDNEHIQNHLNNGSVNYQNNLHNIINTPPVTATVDDGPNGSDSITMTGIRPGTVTFTANLTSPGTDDIQVTGNEIFQEGDIVLITNCITADIFEASSVSDDGTVISHTLFAPTETPGNTNLAQNKCSGTGHCLMAPSDQAYTANNSAAFVLQSITYSIQVNDGVPALWRSVDGDDQELVEGVEQMQVLFGVDTDDDRMTDQYMPSNLVPNPRQIISVRIWLVVRSDTDFTLENRQTYILDSPEEIEAPDLRLRQVFSSTIALRSQAG